MDRSVRRDPFAAFHPAVGFAFFIGAIILCVLMNDLAAQAVGLVCAAAMYLLLEGRSGWKTIAGLAAFGMVLAAINPLLNMRGETVLFLGLGGRPYTLEALGFGASMSLMLVSVLLWFFVYNKVMTADRFTYLFSRFAPALTLVFTMVLRLIPTYQRKAHEIAMARAGIGRSFAKGSVRDRAHTGTAVLSSLVTWALEGSIQTADSMRSRGFGTSKRTFFASYAFSARDLLLFVTMAILFTLALAGVLGGSATMEFFPALRFPPLNGMSLITVLAFGLFLMIPLAMHGGRSLAWRIWLSRI